MRCSMLVCAILSLPLTVSAATYVVKPDGTGDFPTIQAAVNAATDGDIIELTNGIFVGEGNRDIDFLGKSATVRSQGGNPETCIIDCCGSEADPHRGFIFQSDEGPDSVVEGITITHGWTSMGGGGIHCEEFASPTITLCIFLENVAAIGGGMCGGAFSRVTDCSFIGNEGIRGGGMARTWATILSGCTFVANSATYGGGIYMRSSCSPSLIGCAFEENSASHSGGALHVEQHCHPLTEYCTLTGNSAPIGGAVYISIESSPSFVNCTLSGNSSTYTGVVTSGELCYPTIGNTIISYSEQGEAISCLDDCATLVCCDIYGNAGGDWVGSIADQYGVNGNICEDPLFCGGENPDEPLTLHSDSPCAPEQNPECGLVGAWGVGCGWTAVEAVSWGTVKVMFR